MLALSIMLLGDAGVLATESGLASRASSLRSSTQMQTGISREIILSAENNPFSQQQRRLHDYNNQQQQQNDRRLQFTLDGSFSKMYLSPFSVLLEPTNIKFDASAYSTIQRELQNVLEDYIRLKERIPTSSAFRLSLGPIDGVWNGSKTTISVNTIFVTFLRGNEYVIPSPAELNTLVAHAIDKGAFISRLETTELDFIKGNTYIPSNQVNTIPTLSFFQRVVSPFSIKLELAAHSWDVSLYDQLQQKIKDVLQDKISEKTRGGYAGDETKLNYLTVENMEGFFSESKATLRFPSISASFTSIREENVPSSHKLDHWIEYTINNDLVPALNSSPFHYIQQTTYASESRENSDRIPPANPNKITDTVKSRNTSVGVIVGLLIAFLALLIILSWLRFRYLPARKEKESNKNICPGDDMASTFNNINRYESNPNLSLNDKSIFAKEWGAMAPDDDAEIMSAISDDESTKKSSPFVVVPAVYGAHSIDDRFYMWSQSDRSLSNPPSLSESDLSGHPSESMLDDIGALSS